MPGSDVSAVVVGAGPVGLTMAHELVRHGVRCRIIDKNPQPSRQSKALAIHARTLEMLHLMGLADRFLRAGQRVRAGQVHVDGRAAAQVQFDGLDSPYPFVLTLPQSQTERLLIDALQHHGVVVERSTELLQFSQDSAGVSAELRHGEAAAEQVRCDWLIGCDGAHSTVRHGLNLPFDGAEYPDRFLLADVKIEPAPAVDAFHIFADTHGPIALFPMPGGRWRVIADDPPIDFPDSPSLQQCQSLLDARGQSDLRLGDPVWISLFRIHHRWVNRLRVGRAFLAGDSAHIHSPAGGQGMNTGMQDAFNLGWKIGLVSGGLADASLLDSYESERLPVDHAVVKTTDRLTRAMSLKNPVARWARDVLVPMATHVPGLIDRFRDSMAQIDFGYRHSAIVEEHPLAGGGPAAGDRAPDAMLSHPGRGGEAPRLFDLLAGGQHTLLLLTDSGELESAVVEAARAWAAHISICSIATRHGGESAGADDGVTGRYGSQPAAYLIRPDGYVGFRCSLPLAARFLPAYLQRLMGGGVGGVVKSPLPAV